MHLFEPFKLRDVAFRNRVVVSPMCQYSSEDGLANDWHYVHLGSRAVGGAALVFTEAAAVTADGRISPQDLGIWDESHVEPLARITRFIAEHGAVPGIQLAHAGRKASTYRPWSGEGGVSVEEGGWLPVWGPEDTPFTASYPRPTALDATGIAAVTQAFVAATQRALTAGFKVIELHAAHGYLFHEFLSPLSNHRTDAYGGSFENRTRIVRETVKAIRAVWSAELPLFVRLSCTDWVPGGWDIEQTVTLARELATLGVDFIDCSSGGNVPDAKIPVGPGYQTAFAERVKREAGIATGAVGLITDPAQADHIIRTGQADMVLLARELLRDPYWPMRASEALGHPAPWPPQYERAKRRR